MKLATILPTKYLWLSADEDYHMCLAHLIGKDREYTDFFRDMSARGHYVIMDNSIIEDAQVTIAELCEKARFVGAHEIIVPDVFLDKNATLETSWRAVNYVRLNCPELKIMVVPQGRTLEEWLDCFGEMMTWNVDCIGIPKVLSSFKETTNLERGKVLNIIKDVVDEYNELHTKKVDIHLLGCYNSPLELTIISKMEQEGSVPVVRGCDSAVAFAYASNGQRILEDTRIQGQPIDFGNKDVDMDLLCDNIQLWKDSTDITVKKVTKLY